MSSMISISSCVEFVRCAGLSVEASPRCILLRFFFFVISCQHRRQRERSGTSSASSQSGNLSLPQTLLLGTKTKRKKRRYRRTPNSRSQTARQNMCTEDVLRMRRSSARSREVSQQHAGARQHDRGHAKVGSTSSSFNTIQTVEERAARACRAEVASGTTPHSPPITQSTASLSA